MPPGSVPCPTIAAGEPVKSSRPRTHLATPAELKARIEAERVGDPFGVYRNEGDEQRIVTLHGTMRELTIGRHDECEAFARPASNQEIADELFLSVAAVRTHMRALFNVSSIFC